MGAARRRRSVCWLGLRGLERERLVAPELGPRWWVVESLGLSVLVVILAGMTGTTWREVIPEWLVPPVDDVAEYGQMAFLLWEITGCVQTRGQCAALGWLMGRDPSPVVRYEGAGTRRMARGESRLALCMAVGAVHPSVMVQEWVRLGAEPPSLASGDGWWAHGVWRTLSWLLGERPDSPIQLPLRKVDGSIVPGTEVYAVPANPESALWRSAEEGRERRELAEAVQWWSKIRPETVDTER